MGRTFRYCGECAWYNWHQCCCVLGDVFEIRTLIADASGCLGFVSNEIFKNEVEA